MTTQEAIANIYAPKGLTSILAGISTGDYSVLPHEKGIGADLAIAEQEVDRHKQSIKECKSDWAYWSILADLTYWEAIRDILKAATIVGENNLPNVEKPNMDGLVVMDAIGKVSDYGKTILRLAKQKQSNP